MAKGRHTGILAGLLVLAVLAYAGVRSNGFISLDDPVYVTENPHVTGGLTAGNLRWAFTTGHAANWHPLTWMSHMLDVELFGVAPGPLHLVNLGLHLLATALLFLVLGRLTGAPGRSAFVAAVFALHPMHVESVAWLAERKDVLAAIFWMLTLGAYARWVARPSAGRYLAVCAALALGLMSKPMLVTMPFVLLLVDWWPLERPEWRSRPWALVGEKLPLFALVVASSVVTFLVQRAGGAVTGIDAMPFGLRALNALAAYAEYLRRFVWPGGMAIFYPFPVTMPVPMVAAGAVLLLAGSLVAWQWRRTQPAFTVGWLWFVGTLVPVIGLVHVGSQAYADRYTYLPYVGLSIAVAWTVRLPARAAQATIVAAALAMAAGTWQQVGYWKDELSLWGHALAVTTGNYWAHNSYGTALVHAGRAPDAAPHFDEAVRLNPRVPEAQHNLGLSLVARQRSAEALPHLREAVRLQPSFVLAKRDLAVALASSGDIDGALALYREVAAARPNDAAVRDAIGFLLQTQGDVVAALAEYEAALRLNPALADARFHMGFALAAVGRVNDALPHLEEAVALNPGLPMARTYYGIALAAAGRIDDARQQLTRALEQNAGDEVARRSLAALPR